MIDRPAEMDIHHLEQRTLGETRRLVGLAESHFRIRLPTPDVRFNLTGRSAGMVVFPRRGPAVIRYNRQILHENGEPFIRQTVPHEVAHLVARTLHGFRIRPHGPEWAAIMRLFDAVADRCHNFSVQNLPLRRMRYFAYRCGCRDHRLSAVRHNRHQAGVRYLCRACGAPLLPVGNDP